MKETLFNLEIDFPEENVAEITIDGIIGEDFFAEDENTKQRMRDQLRKVREVEASKIIVNISSLGGDVDHGLAIHDLLAANPAEVETNVIGMTASAATIIAQAGTVRRMSDNALYLVHRAWTIGAGNANDFEALTNDLRKLDDRISNIYSKRSGESKEGFLELMNKSNGDGIWISAQEAKDFGLIDEVTEPMKAAAMDVSVFDKYGIPKPNALKDKNPSGIVVPVNIELSVNGKPYEEGMKSFKNDLRFLNGENLARFLNDAIDDEMTEDRSRADIIQDMADAAGIEPSTVNNILTGNIICPPLRRLEGFAEVLDVTVEAQISAAEVDGCEYDENNNLLSCPKQTSANATSRERAKLEILKTKHKYDE